MPRLIRGLSLLVGLIACALGPAGAPAGAAPMVDGGAAHPAVRAGKPVRVVITVGSSAPVVTATASVVRVHVSGVKVTVTGAVRLSANGDTAANLSRTRVVLALTNPELNTQRVTAPVTAAGSYGTTFATPLYGHLVLTVGAVIQGGRSGRLVVRRFSIAAPIRVPQPLIGVFDLQAGAAPAGSAPTGSYLEILGPNGAPVANLSSPAANKDDTPLSPGTDGGLSTETYQPAPAPAFSHGTGGGAVADAIVAPVAFDLVNLSVETAPTDAQLAVHDPLPVIDVLGDVLSGQITAWEVQWNGQSFNQGTPKPGAAGSSLTGTYDPATRAFALQWTSAFTAGSLRGDTGVWHLAGTFAPSSS